MPGHPYRLAWLVVGVFRYWTQGEQKDLFQHYFDSTTALCPVCGNSVWFRMNHTRELVSLVVRCHGCDNLAVLFFGGLVGLPAEKAAPEPGRF